MCIFVNHAYIKHHHLCIPSSPTSEQPHHASSPTSEQPHHAWSRSAQIRRRSPEEVVLDQKRHAACKRTQNKSREIKLTRDRHGAHKIHCSSHSKTYIVAHVAHVLVVKAVAAVLRRAVDHVVLDERHAEQHRLDVAHVLAPVVKRLAEGGGALIKVLRMQYLRGQATGEKRKVTHTRKCKNR